MLSDSDRLASTLYQLWGCRETRHAIIQTLYSLAAVGAVLKLVVYCCLGRWTIGATYTRQEETLHGLFFVVGAFIYASIVGYLEEPQSKTGAAGESYLPPVTLSQIEYQRSKTVSDCTRGCCPICLVDFEEKETVNHGQCQHFFHSNCIQSWIHQERNCVALGCGTRQRPTCPCCRQYFGGVAPTHQRDKTE